jgi:hypothetical protein
MPWPFQPKQCNWRHGGWRGGGWGDAGTREAMERVELNEELESTKGRKEE